MQQQEVHRFRQLARVMADNAGTEARDDGRDERLIRETRQEGYGHAAGEGGECGSQTARAAITA